MTVLEQVHQGRFQLPAAAPSLSNPQPSPDTLPDAAPPMRSKNSSSVRPLAQTPTDRQAASGPPNSVSTAQDEWQSGKQAQPAASSPSGKEGTDQQDAAQSLPDAWQQQTFRLQAFTKPLMQHLQGEAISKLFFQLTHSVARRHTYTLLQKCMTFLCAGLTEVCAMFCISTYQFCMKRVQLPQGAAESGVSCLGNECHATHVLIATLRLHFCM